VKNFFLIFFLASLIGCNTKAPVKAYEIPYELAPRIFKCDSIIAVNAKIQNDLKDSLAVYQELVIKWKTRSDTLNSRLFISNMKVTKCKYYLDIVNRNPTQIKYLRGWLNNEVFYPPK
jgi:hypothetical protein